MSRKLVLLPMSAAIGLAVGLLLSSREGTAGPVPVEAPPCPPEPDKKPARESLMQLNGSLRELVGLAPGDAGQVRLSGPWALRFAVP